MNFCERKLCIMSNNNTNNKEVDWFQIIINVSSAIVIPIVVAFISIHISDKSYENQTKSKEIENKEKLFLELNQYRTKNSDFNIKFNTYISGTRLYFGSVTKNKLDQLIEWYNETGSTNTTIINDLSQDMRKEIECYKSNKYDFGNNRCIQLKEASEKFKGIKRNVKKEEIEDFGNYYQLKTKGDGFENVYKLNSLSLTGDIDRTINCTEKGISSKKCLDSKNIKLYITKFLKINENQIQIKILKVIEKNYYDGILFYKNKTQHFQISIDGKNFKWID